MMQCDSSICPCGSGKLLADCCGPYLDRLREAESAEALMRSRYTAYTLGDLEYIHATWYPATRPASLPAHADEQNLKWLGLKIVRVEGGTASDDAGMVEFKARYKVAGKGGRLHERSRFVKEQGRWFYVGGEQF